MAGLQTIRQFARWCCAYRAYKHRRPDQAFTPPSGDMPGGAALAGPTNIVGRIRRLRRHPATCPVALRLPGLQKNAGIYL
ncbi:hypothetical protein HMPREF3207_02546 [Citrobacter koseri]|nr:hypothetical protein HMPREF3207_02546 [Citrobacter koseri]